MPVPQRDVAEAMREFDALIAQSQEGARAYEAARGERDHLRSFSAYGRVLFVACMDERCRSMEHDVGLPMGYARFIRTKGARIFLSHHQVRATVGRLISADEHRPVLIVFTAHYSAQHADHGCAGWDNDVVAAFSHQRRVAEAFRRLYAGRVHTVVAAYETDEGVLMFPASCAHEVDQSFCTPQLGESDYVIAREVVYTRDERVRDDACAGLAYELMVMLDAIAKRRASRPHAADSREAKHSATWMHVGSGFEFARESGCAVMVGLHSSSLIDDVALGIERIILPEAARRRQSGYVVINRVYDGAAHGDREMAMDWVHAVLEDVMCLFRDDVDAGHLHIMTSVSTRSGVLEPIVRL